jgi:hypothetical protein
MKLSLVLEDETNAPEKMMSVVAARHNVPRGENGSRKDHCSQVCSVHGGTLEMIDTVWSRFRGKEKMKYLLSCDGLACIAVVHQHSAPAA